MNFKPENAFDRIALHRSRLGGWLSTVILYWMLMQLVYLYADTSNGKIFSIQVALMLAGTLVILPWLTGLSVPGKIIRLHFSAHPSPFALGEASIHHHLLKFFKVVFYRWRNKGRLDSGARTLARSLLRDSIDMTAYALHCGFKRVHVASILLNEPSVQEIFVRQLRFKVPTICFDYPRTQRISGLKRALLAAAGGVPIQAIPSHQVHYVFHLGKPNSYIKSC